MPLILDNKLSAVLSHDNMVWAKPETIIILWSGLIFEPSFFRIFTLHPLEKKMYLVY